MKKWLENYIRREQSSVFKFRLLKDDEYEDNNGTTMCQAVLYDGCSYKTVTALFREETELPYSVLEGVFDEKIAQAIADDMNRKEKLLNAYHNEGERAGA